jgi:hypothetical protein
MDHILKQTHPGLGLFEVYYGDCTHSDFLNCRFITKRKIHPYCFDGYDGLPTLYYTGIAVNVFELSFRKILWRMKDKLTNTLVKLKFMKKPKSFLDL